MSVLALLQEARRAVTPAHVAGAAALGLVVTVLYLVWYSHTSGLSHIPGPWLARYTNLHAWWAAQRTFGTNVCYLRALHARYGDVVRVAPRRVSVCDPAAIPAIYGMRAALDKADLIRAAQPMGKGHADNLFSVRDARSHAPMRRAVANAYATTTLVHFEPRIDAVLEAFFRVLASEGAGAGADVNIGHWTHYYVYDVQGNVTYGEPLGYLESKTDALGLSWQTKLLHKYVAFTMPMPMLHDIASFFVRTFRAQKATIFHQLSASRVRARLRAAQQEGGAPGGEKDKTKGDILAHFVAAARDRHADQLSEDQMVMHCMVNVIAGIGTSTTSMVNVLRHLVATPAAQERLHAELRAAGVGRGGDGAPAAAASWRETQALPFLEGLVREGVRLRDSSGVNPLAREVGAAGLVLPDGTRLPPGTVVGVKPSVASVQERTFGPAPYAFVPERWLPRPGEPDAAFRDRRAAMDRGDMSFSAGTRGCIGRPIALMEIYKLLATLILRYKLLPAKSPHQSKGSFDFFCTLEPREASYPANA